MFYVLWQTIVNMSCMWESSFSHSNKSYISLWFKCRLLPDNLNNLELSIRGCVNYISSVLNQRISTGHVMNFQKRNMGLSLTSITLGQLDWYSKDQTINETLFA